MNIGHWQLETSPGNVAANTAKLIDCLAEAQRQDLAIVSFPESFLTGYFTDAALARKHSLRTDGPEIADLLKQTASYSPTFMVGYNELRGEQLFNTVLVAERGKLLGTYSKAFPCYDYFAPGREFPVFERDGVRFGVVICADGGYIEPSRILALKGAQIIFAPHYNYIAPAGLINHFQKVRSDHIARAVENNVWFLRANSVGYGYDKGLDMEGVGYGDSYLLDPMGEMVARAARHKENLMTAHIDIEPTTPECRRSIASAAALLDQLREAVESATDQSSL